MHWPLGTKSQLPRGRQLCHYGQYYFSEWRAQVHEIPDHARTPGALNPIVTQQNLAQTVCKVGWTDTIRPPKSDVKNLRRKQMRELGQPGVPNAYHEDHIVPLCAGGHPSDERNLWPQPVNGRWRDADKNQLELSVCRQLCRGEIDLNEAQAWFLSEDCTKSYERYFPGIHAVRVVR